MNLFDIAPKGWWDEERPPAAADVASDTTEDASNSLLILASHHYEDAAAAVTANMEEEDHLLLLALQQYENANAMAAESPETSTSASKKARVDDLGTLVDPKAKVGISKAGHYLYFGSSSNMTLNVS